MTDACGKPDVYALRHRRPTRGRRSPTTRCRPAGSPAAAWPGGLLRRRHQRRRGHQAGRTPTTRPPTPGRRSPTCRSTCGRLGYRRPTALLVVSGGVTDGHTAVTNQGFAYDPATDAWTALSRTPTTRCTAAARVRLLQGRRLAPAGSTRSTRPRCCPASTECTAAERRGLAVGGAHQLHGGAGRKVLGRGDPRRHVGRSPSRATTPPDPRRQPTPPYRGRPRSA